jgi:hypothetical protein
MKSRVKRGEKRLELANPPELRWVIHADSFTLPTSHPGSISSSAPFSLERKQLRLMACIYRVRPLLRTK